jgi:hypothetical protein
MRDDRTDASRSFMRSTGTLKMVDPPLCDECKVFFG